MTSFLARYSHGFNAPLRGLGYLRQNRSLWKWVLPPALVNTLITLFAVVMLFWLSWELIAWAWPQYGSSFWQWVSKIAAAIGIVVGVIGLTVVTWLILTSVCAGYLLGVLASKVERQMGISEQDIHEISLVREGAEAIFETTVIVTIHAVAFFVQFIPVIGTVVSVPAVLITDAYVLGWEILSYPMGVRGMTLRERRAFIKRHRPEVLGLGTTVLPTSVIPVLGGLMMTFATVGACILYREMVEQEASEPLIEA